MRPCMHPCAHACIHAPMHASMRPCMYSCAHAFTPMQNCRCPYVCAHIYMHKTAPMRPYTYTQGSTHAPTHIHKAAPMHVPIYMHKAAPMHRSGLYQLFGIQNGTRSILCIAKSTKFTKFTKNYTLPPFQPQWHSSGVAMGQGNRTGCQWPGAHKGPQ